MQALGGEESSGQEGPLKRGQSYTVKSQRDGRQGVGGLVEKGWGVNLSCPTFPGSALSPKENQPARAQRDVGEGRYPQICTQGKPRPRGAGTCLGLTSPWDSPFLYFIAPKI